MKFIVGIFVIFVLCLGVVEVEEISNIFPLCSRRVPDVGKCLKDGLNKLRPRLASGKIGPGFVTPPLDPYVINDFEVGGLPFLKLNLHDIEIIGTTKFELLDIKAWFEGKYLKFMPHVAYDKLLIKGKYSFYGFIPLPLTGEVSFSLNNLKIRGDGRVRLYKKNGEEFFHIEQAILKIESIRPGDIKYKLPIGPSIRSFFGNILFRILGDPITKIVYRILERRIDKVHLDVGNSLIKNVPVSYFFSE